MFFSLNSHLSPHKKLEETDDPQIGIFTLEEWAVFSQRFHSLNLAHEHLKKRFCKLERYPGYLYGSFSIPHKSRKESNRFLPFYVIGGNLYFINEGRELFAMIEKIRARELGEPYDIGRFFCDFFEILLKDDLMFLERLEEKLSKMEDWALGDAPDSFIGQMVTIKKTILRFYHYYSELLEMGQELLEADLFSNHTKILFKPQVSHIARLQNETQMLREYAVQVREVYQSQLDLRQNKIMKVLTVVTTIFFPLSVIAGWYGMNFRYMPELSWKYGYLFIVFLSAAVLLLGIWIIKKKKFW